MNIYFSSVVAFCLAQNMPNRKKKYLIDLIDINIFTLDLCLNK